MDTIIQSILFVSIFLIYDIFASYWELHTHHKMHGHHWIVSSGFSLEYIKNK